MDVHIEARARTAESLDKVLNQIIGTEYGFFLKKKNKCADQQKYCNQL
jgi:hypothetical protein